MKNTKSCVQDTTDFIIQVNTVANIPFDNIVVSLGVKSFYTNIANCEVMKAFCETLNA